MSFTNVEVQVALLRAGMHRKNLAKLLDMNEKTFSTRFSREMPAQLQECLIELIRCVASGREPTERDLANYKRCLDGMKKHSNRLQDEIDERTIAFVEWAETKRDNYEDLDALENTFGISKE